MAVDIDFFRKVMGHFATGVTIATTRGQTGPAGLTVNSFTSVSLNPLLVLICVDLRSQALPFFRESGVFAANILTQEQENLSNGFATPSEERYTFFCHAEYTQAVTGAPILKDTLGFVDTRIVAEYPGGDHVILLGQVEAMGYNGQVFSLSDGSNEQNALPSLAGPAEQTNNGHSPTEGEQKAPLLYYQGQYYHLSSRYHHDYPPLIPAVQSKKDE
jgi:flavin reductase (DIM6/NTAB) family NADH-FMN oxidoreductase RutF